MHFIAYALHRTKLHSSVTFATLVLLQRLGVEHPHAPPPSSGSNIKLPDFIAYALHKTKLHSSVTFTTLVLLQCLKVKLSA
ncbi:hypothetical protein BJ138DRAFT_1018448 [Hygrophoropsis aurantiaca]|uniref:Uncharacterized protein n=1 Tax=Hygrophoropsis aurantiaca TaxID=72124 RepID=A0ACB7ZW06_9AGAM|nr:hypothetical protein BJ138DRAFT_1018448 [Hygrophoropsis aurantiaca]